MPAVTISSPIGRLRTREHIERGRSAAPIYVVSAAACAGLRSGMRAYLAMNSSVSSRA